MREQQAEKQILRLGLSPCPNDTFIFHALLHDLVCIPGFTSHKCLPQLADVEQLNRRAIEGEYEITKLSLGVVPEVIDKYALLSAGAALGWGCGPLLVGRKQYLPEELSDLKIAIPGKLTTANLLLDLHGGFNGQRQAMLFSDIMPAVMCGEADLGLIIHEGRFTYAGKGLYKILDLGEWWEKVYNMPLPLGAIAVRRDVAKELALAMENAIQASLAHAWRNPDHSREFIRLHAQEMDEAVTKAHIQTFVTSYSMNLGDSGQRAIEKLLEKALLKKGFKSGEKLFLNSAGF